MRTSVLLIGILAYPILVTAADPVFDVKMGLWEVSNTMQMSGMPPIPNFDQLPPEQRARVEAAMKRMSGAPHTTTNRSCVTREGIQESIARAASPQQDSCDPKLVSMTSSKVVLRVECKPKNGGQSNGDVVIERADSEHFTGTGDVKTNDASGHNMEIKMTMAGKFISSDCGKLKPDTTERGAGDGHR